MIREVSDGLVAFVVNNSRNTTHQVIVSFHMPGEVSELNLLTGQIISIPVEVAQDETKFYTSLQPADSKVYMLRENKQALSTPLVIPYCHPHSVKEVLTALPAAAAFDRTDPNALVLDFCRYRIGQGEWSQRMEIWKAQREIRAALGLRPNNDNGDIQRYLWVDEVADRDGTNVELEFTFFVEEIPKNIPFVAIEQAEQFDVQCNGVPCPRDLNDYFWDPSIEKIQLTGLNPGENRVVLTCAYKNRMELENIYIIGDFGVSIDRKIIQEPATLHLGDWCLQGYPFYAGGIVYHFSSEVEEIGTQANLRLGHCHSAITEVRINGEQAGVIPWQAADGLDVTELLQIGTNAVDIEVAATPRNLFGPFHKKYDNCARNDSADFQCEGNAYSEEYLLKPYGLVHPVVIYKGSL